MDNDVLGIKYDRRILDSLEKKNIDVTTSIHNLCSLALGCQRNGLPPYKSKKYRLKVYEDSIGHDCVKLSKGLFTLFKYNSSICEGTFIDIDRLGDIADFFLSFKEWQKTESEKQLHLVESQKEYLNILNEIEGDI